MRSFIFGVLLILSCTSYAATFEQGLAHYQAGEFAEARKIFQQLAELGNERAQFNIGVMHLRGEDVAQDRAKAWAWMQIAKENKHEHADGAIATTEKKMTPQERELANEHLTGLRKQYSNVEISNRLLPIFDSKNAHISSTRPTYVHQPKYPAAMARAGKSGFVDIQYVSGRDGTARYFNVIYSPDKAFSAAAYEALQRSRFQPAKTNSGTTLEFSRRFRFIFKMAGSVLKAEELQAYIDENKQKAEEGGAQEKLLFAYSMDAMRSNYGGMKGAESIRWENSNKWFIKAAQDGAALAKYQLGLNTLNGDQCDVDHQKSLYWLTTAATDNVLDAQFALGYELLVGVRFEQNIAEGKKLLATAADKGLPEAQLLLAWLLATHPDENFRSADLAQQYFAKAADSFNDQRSYQETATAVALIQKDWKQAGKSLKALSKLNKKYDAPQERELGLAQALKDKQIYLESL